MSNPPKDTIIKLQSVLLTNEKQQKLEREFDTYYAATNFVIKERIRRTLTKWTLTIESLRDDFSEKFDSRESYFLDVVKTAGSEIKAHQRLAVTIRSMRDKIPHFKSGRMILSRPLLTISKSGLVLTCKDGSNIPMPFDKRSKNRVLDQLDELEKYPNKCGRIRLTWYDEGYVDIDIRAKF